MFTGAKMDNKNLRTEKTWGCPAYVLDPKLRDKKYLNGVLEQERGSISESPQHMPVQ